MNTEQSARAGYFQGKRQEIALRYTYRPEFVPLLLEYLGAKPGTRILETGCGSGFFSRLLARTLPDVQLLALDTDGEMLNIARQMKEREGLSGSIQLGYGDAFQLPFPDNSFDLVTSHRLL
jgi:ubiquinone/menaquinone biosynthesis C-methylase UbiE